MTRTTVTFEVLFLCGALASLGCSAQADTSYRGEPIATLSGSVQAADTSAAVPVDAALAWVQVAPDAKTKKLGIVNWIAQATPVTGQFPAQFTLSIYAPPPADALIPCASASAHIAVAVIAAVRSGADLSAPNVSSAVLGQSLDDMLIYLDSDQAPGWTCIPDMGITFAPTKGYHLIEAIPGSTQARAGGAVYPAFLEAPQGLATPVTITIGASRDPNGGAATVN